MKLPKAALVLIGSLALLTVGAPIASAAPAYGYGYSHYGYHGYSHYGSDYGYGSGYGYGYGHHGGYGHH